jgi:hypothetical protein
VESNPSVNGQEAFRTARRTLTPLSIVASSPTLYLIAQPTCVLFFVWRFVKSDFLPWVGNEIGDEFPDS